MKRQETENNEMIQFEHLYKTNAPRLIFYAEKYVDSDTAEDLVQDIFIKIWEKRTFLFFNGGLTTYLYRSVQHACLDCLKREDIKESYIESVIKQLKIEEIYFNDDPKSLFNKDERLQMIYHEVEKLPERCRDIFTMSYMEERKTPEIAKLLNISQRTVEAQLYKALKTLRDVLSGVTLFLLAIC
ncbi:MAG: RNA polymerase sigma-70 factor [Parabacteroides sp.]|nr:RNA polymerase sigma-70 factor [Parabacteroides sp.]